METREARYKRYYSGKQMRSKACAPPRVPLPSASRPVTTSRTVRPVGMVDWSEIN